MAAYVFTTAFDGSVLSTIHAYNPTMACNLFLKGWGDYNPAHDVMAICNGRVQAVISARGGRRPDVMILDYMRAKILAG